MGTDKASKPFWWKYYLLMLRNTLASQVKQFAHDEIVVHR